VENAVGSVTDPDPDGPLDRLFLDFGGRWHDGLDEEDVRRVVANMDDGLLLPPGHDRPMMG
jgi:hypothetical protein